MPSRCSDAFPWRGRVGQHLGQGCQALALGPGPSVGAGQARRCRVVKRGVEAQAGDAGHAAAAERCQEFQGGKAAVAHHHQLAARQPAPGLQRQLPSPIRQLLVLPSALLAVALRRGERRQERQRPHPPCPGDRGQEHEAEPAQAACLDEVPMAGAYRVAINAFGCDALTPSALNRVVNAQHNGSGRHENVEQQSQQHTRCSPGAPFGTVEHAMAVDEPSLVHQAHDAQKAGHGMLARRQDGTGQQSFSVPPTPLKEQRRKRQDHRGEAGRQAGHGDVSWRGRVILTHRPLRRPSHCQASWKWPKSN